MRWRRRRRRETIRGVPERSLILLGAGGHASVVAESAVAAGWNILGYCAAEPSRESHCGALAVPWLGDVDHPKPDLERHLTNGARVHAAVGDAKLRERWSARFGVERLATIVHPGTWISPSAAIAPGVYVGAFAVINATAIIGIGTIVNTGAIVEHGVRVGSYVHCAPRSTLAGLAEVGDRTLIGAGAVVLPFVKVGSDSIVGAGAIVHRDVDPRTTVVGIPAKPVEARV
jgi:sugar O-acyltransferase (sialic acid O-acetyltransferase NeuD family)